MKRFDWVECPRCGHKLFKWIDGEWVLEVKCPSCKGIMKIERRRKHVQTEESMQ